LFICCPQPQLRFRITLLRGLLQPKCSFGEVILQVRQSEGALGWRVALFSRFQIPPFGLFGVFLYNSTFLINAAR
jgi:hypothetical protein